MIRRVLSLLHLRRSRHEYQPEEYEGPYGASRDMGDLWDYGVKSGWWKPQ